LFEEYDDEEFLDDDNEPRSVVIEKSQHSGNGNSSQAMKLRHFSADDYPASLRGNGMTFCAEFVTDLERQLLIPAGAYGILHFCLFVPDF